MLEMQPEIEVDTHVEVDAHQPPEIDPAVAEQDQGRGAELYERFEAAQAREDRDHGLSR